MVYTVCDRLLLCVQMTTPTHHAYGIILGTHIIM